MENLPESDHEKEMNLMGLIKVKLTEQGETLNKMAAITDLLKDIGTNIGKENARVMLDIKYRAEFEELIKKDKKLAQEIKDLEEKLRVFRAGK